jgi:membrane protease YdiL (CAAX protease family)
MRLFPLLEVVLVLILLLGAEVLAMSLLGITSSEQVVPLDLLQMKMVQVPLVLLVIHRLMQRQGKSLLHLGLIRPQGGWDKAVGTGMAFTVPLLLVSFIVIHIGNRLFPRDAPLPFDLNTPWALPSFLLVVVLAGGVAEEIQFRGFVFHRLEQFFHSFGGTRQRATVRAAFLVSALFAFLHIYEGPAAVLAIFVVSLGLQALYLISGRNLVACMVCHSLFNIIQLGLMFYANTILGD